MGKSGKMLGLALTEQGLVAAEVAVNAAQRTLLASATLDFSGECTLEQPEKLGKQLKALLHQKGFSSSRCVIGLAANSIASKEIVLPAADESALRGALTIAAERDFASGQQDLAFDYSLSQMAKGAFAMLAAAPRRIIQQVEQMTQSAGLSLAGVTSSAVALAAATQTDSDSRRLLCLTDRGAELVISSGRSVCLLRHLPARLSGPDAQVTQLGGELRRILYLAPMEPLADAQGEWLLWDLSKLGGETLQAVGTHLEVPWRAGDLRADLHLAESPERLSGALATAVALACGGLDGLILDFVHSRLTPPRQSRLGRKATWGLIAGVLVLAAGVAFALDWRANQTDVALLQRQWADMKDGVKDAQALVDNVGFVRGWHDRRPEFLSCLREITQCFPQEGRIWATSLTIQEDMQIMLSGKATSEDAVLDVLDRLKNDPRLMNIKPLSISQGTGSNRDISFAISLNVRGAN